MPELDPTNLEGIQGAGESRHAAQWWLLFAILVANKSAESTEKKLKALLGSLRRVGGYEKEPPFQAISWGLSVYTLGNHLRAHRVGQYQRILKAFEGVTKLAAESNDDPRTWSVVDLEAIHGIGPKTARWFYLLCHPEEPVAALDTHVLKFLRDQDIECPRSTPPSGEKYQALEKQFCALAETLGLKPRDLDFFVWSVYRNHGHITFDEV